MKNGMLAISLFVIFFTSCQEDELQKVDQPFISNWVNIDPGTPYITKIHFKVAGDKLGISMWGDCEPEDCEWGTEKVPLVSAKDSVITVHWDFGFATKDQTVEYSADDKILVETYTVFHDNSGRFPYTTHETFIPETESN